MILPSNIVLEDEDILSIIEQNKLALERLDAALQLNPTNFYSFYLLFYSYNNGTIFSIYKVKDYPSEFYRLELYEHAYKLLDHPLLSEKYEAIRSDCYFQLADVFRLYLNYSSAYKYAKLACERRLRSSYHNDVAHVKELYLEMRAAFAKVPPLRFAVGDEVEFLHELETGSEWKLGKVEELYYRERAFDITFSAPFRLQRLDDSATVDEPPVYARVKADLNRYVRKVGVRSIEDTCYQARLDAKVEELSCVYCSENFIKNIYLTLAQDQEFLEMMLSVWKIELSVHIVVIYRVLVMYRHPLIRTDSGYHIPTAEEVIAEIRAYFDPHLSIEAATSAAAVEDTYSQNIRAVIINMLQGHDPISLNLKDEYNIQVCLTYSIQHYILVWPIPDLPITNTIDRGSGFTCPVEVSEAIAKASTATDLKIIRLNCGDGVQLKRYLSTWIALQYCLENHDAVSACECPFLYFFVKRCLDDRLGVPKLALALYDGMNMQLSREFIRCANPTCELNKLDKSTGKVKFKQCSRCHAVIYCSRECQVAHYPEHKRLCKEHLTGLEGS